MSRGWEGQRKLNEKNISSVIYAYNKNKVFRIWIVKNLSKVLIIFSFADISTF